MSNNNDDENEDIRELNRMLNSHPIRNMNNVFIKEMETDMMIRNLDILPKHLPTLVVMKKKDLEAQIIFTLSTRFNIDDSVKKFIFELQEKGYFKDSEEEIRLYL